MQQPSRSAARIEPGDILPRLALTGPRGETIDTGAPPMAGRVNFLVFAGGNTKATSALLATMTDHRARIEALGARSFLVVPAAPSAAPLAGGTGGTGLPGLGGGPRPMGLPGGGDGAPIFGRNPTHDPPRPRRRPGETSR